ncbi:DEAD box RNA helicase [Corchorus olitorius]|uniref:DEAD box RNA helicase n=1 Tax=Corchorus olitorius TaxID=93759 RepID=A0A1R3K3E6_9ROSI|nr:DEAD box RNA helicase [Corchorus olitorius]
MARPYHLPHICVATQKNFDILYSTPSYSNPQVILSSTIDIKFHYPIIGWYPSQKELLIRQRLSDDEVMHYLTSRMNDISNEKPFPHQPNE